MKYGKHLVSTSAIYQLNGYFRNFPGHLTCNSNFRGYNRPRKLKTANIYPHVFEAKTRKFGDAKIFHFMVYNFYNLPLPRVCLSWQTAQTLMRRRILRHLIGSMLFHSLYIILFGMHSACSTSVYFESCLRPNEIFPLAAYNKFRIVHCKLLKKPDTYCVSIFWE